VNKKSGNTKKAHGVYNMRTSKALLISIILIIGGISTVIGKDSKKLTEINDNFIASPARISPLARSKSRIYIDMDGYWNFAVDPNDVGKKEKWFNGNPAFKKKVFVPGNWHSQGIGGKGPSHTIADAFCAIRQDVLQIPGKYYGPAWYRKTIKLSNNWKNKKIWLKFGGAMPNVMVWVNEHPVGSRYTDGTSFKFDVTGIMRPGKENSVSVRIDNRVRMTATVQHLNCFFHWGGLFDSIELEGMELAYISRVMIRPNINKKQSEFRITVTNSSKKKSALDIVAMVKSKEFFFKGSPAKIILSPEESKEILIAVKINPLRTWSPDAPYLYNAVINLKKEDKTIDQWTDRFGMRTIRSEGGHLFLNEQPIIIRGSSFAGYFFNNISPWTKVEDYKWRLKKLKSLGFIYHRLPWIPPRACFEAADEVGAMLQIEIPYMTKNFLHRREKIKKRLLRELAVERNNHPSLITFCMSNERAYGNKLISKMYHLAKKIDPTRLAIDTDGAGTPRKTMDFWTPYHDRKNLASNYNKMPIVEHEYMNIPTLPDLDAINYYATVIMPPPNLLSFKQWLIKQNLLNKYENYLRSSYYMQGIFLKRGIEFIRAHSYRAGYIIVAGSNIDCYMVWSGLLGTMYKEKGFSTKAASMINNKSVLLANFPKVTSPYSPRIDPVHLYNRRVQVPIIVSHYGRKPIADAELSWHLEYKGKILRQGKIKSVKAKSYQISKIGTISFKVKKRSQPIKSKLFLSLEGKNIFLHNQYNLWFFPESKPSEIITKNRIWVDLDYKGREELALLTQNKSISTAKPKGKIDLIITDKISPHRKYIEEGGRVVLLSVKELNWIPAEFSPGWWKMNNRSGGLVIADHPALESFPHENVAEEQFSFIANRAVIFNNYFNMIEPIISGITFRNYPDTDAKILVHLFQVNVGKGKLLVSGLNLKSKYIESEYLLWKLVEYALSDKFVPNKTIKTVDMLKPLFTIGSFFSREAAIKHFTKKLQKSNGRIEDIKKIAALKLVDIETVQTLGPLLVNCLKTTERWKATNPLANLLQNLNNETRKKIFPRFIKIIKNKKENEKTREAALYTLGILKGMATGTIPDIKKIIFDVQNTTNIRISAIWALGAIAGHDDNEFRQIITKIVKEAKDLKLRNSTKKMWGDFIN
jgi:hypothetical protein